MKKSFILHLDTLSIIDNLSDEQCGQLLRLMRDFHREKNGEKNPEEPKETQITQLVFLVFHPFKMQFERDFQTYQDVSERNKNNGKLGGRPKKQNPDKPRKADNDNDNDSDNEKDNDKIHTSISHLKITHDEYARLISFGYSDKQIQDVFDSIKNYAKNKKYKSLFLTAKRWLEKDKEFNRSTSVKSNDYKPFVNPDSNQW